MNRLCRQCSAGLLAAASVLLAPALPAVHLVGPETEVPLALTERERAWLDEHPIVRASNDPAYAPVDFDGPDGMPAGLAAELMALVAHRLDLNIEYVPGQSWVEAYDAARRRDVDLLIAVPKTQERERHFAFTAPFMTYRSVIVVRNDAPFVPDITALTDRRFALVTGYAETERLLALYPALQVTPFATVGDALEAVATGEADATVGNIAVLHHKIRELGLTNLKVAAPSDDEERRIYFAVRDDWPELVGILNKGLAAISLQERQQILDRWVNVEFERGLDPARVWRTTLQALAGIAVVGLLVLAYLRRLKREIAKRRRLQEQLAEARERVVDLAQGLPGVVYQSFARPDGSGEVVFGREAYYRLLGIDSDASNLTWDMMAQVVVEEDHQRLHAALGKAVHTLDMFQVDFRVKGKPGEEPRWIHIEAIPKKSNDPGIVSTWNGYAIDITERKRLESELARTREAADAANRAKSDFLANMSHEIRTPMNAIIGLSHLAIKSGLEGRQKDYLTKISGAAQSLLRIVNDVLDFSKIEAGQLTLEKIRFNLHAVFDDLISIVGHRAAEKGLELRMDVAPELPAYLIGDSLRLSQVLLNLTGNAIKFTQRGHIVVRAQQIETVGANVVLRFAVEDTGIGLSSEQIGRLFHSFAQADSSTTRQFGGTGLGLSISKRLVALMGGEIGVTSEVGRGSVFWFTVTLPRAPAPEAAVAAVKPGPPANLRGSRVLLVEDNEINQQVATELLQAASVRVDIVGNGLDALRAVRTQPYDAVLMDVQMPIMDGLQATQAIRAIDELRSLPIIAMTASVMRNDRERCLEAGMNDYISKPINVDQMLATLGRWLAAAGTALAAHPRAAPPKPLATELPETLDGINVADGLKRVSGDRALYRRLLLQFREHSANAAADIRAALARGDRAAVKSATHTLKGVAGTLGADELYQATQKLEAGLRRGMPGEAEVEALASAHARIMGALVALKPPAAPTNGEGKPVDPAILKRLVGDLDERLSGNDASAAQALAAVKVALGGTHTTIVQDLERLIGAYNFEQARTRLAELAKTLEVR